MFGHEPLSVLSLKSPDSPECRSPVGYHHEPKLPDFTVVIETYVRRTVVPVTPLVENQNNADQRQYRNRQFRLLSLRYYRGATPVCERAN